MKKETIYLIILILVILIVGGYLLFFYKKPAKPSFIFPKKIATTTEITLPPPPGITNLGKIQKFEAKRFQSGDFISEYLLVYKEGLKPKTKLYMPYDGYVFYDEKQGNPNVNLQIRTKDNSKIIGILGPLKGLCQVTKKESNEKNKVTRYYCDDVKKGALIAEVSEEIQKIDKEIALNIHGYVNYKDDINFLYENLPLIFK